LLLVAAHSASSWAKIARASSLATSGLGTETTAISCALSASAPIEHQGEVRSQSAKGSVAAGEGRHGFGHLCLGPGRPPREQAGIVRGHDRLTARVEGERPYHAAFEVHLRQLGHFGAGLSSARQDEGKAIRMEDLPPISGRVSSAVEEKIPHPGSDQWQALLS
jgi:hypothetical protein